VQGPSPQPKSYDCIVLGTGIGGSMLGAILARNGLSVLMLDSEAHPRFAIGEATTPDTNLRLRLLSVKYDVPEIGHFSAFEPLRDNVSAQCGVKRAFTLKGHVDSLAGGTGARFSLLPPDNASGNFTKVVQRVPVLIKLDSDTELSLRPGLSAQVTVRTK